MRRSPAYQTAILIAVLPLTAHADFAPTAAEAGRLTGIGIHCGYAAQTTPLKKAIADAAQRDSLTEPEREEIRVAYADARTKAFNTATSAGSACPSPEAFEALVESVVSDLGR